MTPRILDEQALEARELEIINTAIALIQKLGVEHLTMDKVVAAVPYSKGTVYKHFDGKEDLLLAISNHAILILSDLFWRSAQFEGCSRERMLLLNFSYLIYAILHPALFQTVVCSKSQNVQGKSSEKRLEQQQQLEFKVLGTIHGIVDQAISEGTLVMPEHMSIPQLCFASWSMSYGTISLLSGEVEQCSGRNDMVVERELFNQNNLLFDGLGWAPLSKEKDYSQALKQAINEIFAKELQLMHEKGRELNF